MSQHWGFHMVVDASKCNPESIRNVKHIKKFTKILVKEIDMLAYGDPRIVHFGRGGKAGYTLIQLIETSTISIHFVEKTNDMYFDLFSCENFDRKIVKQIIQEFFQPEVIHERFLYRNANK